MLGEYVFLDKLQPVLSLCYFLGQYQKVTKKV